jgi:tetratricopeptide (TPR) repeat protein
MNTTYKFRSAEYLLDLGYQEEGIKELEKVLLFDSRNDEIMDVLAIAYFLRGYTDRAIHYRERITVVNPWDARNYLILGQLYKANGDFEKMSVVKSKIISFASTTEEGRRAIAELNS